MVVSSPMIVSLPPAAGGDGGGGCGTVTVLERRSLPAPAGAGGSGGGVRIHVRSRSLIGAGLHGIVDGAITSSSSGSTATGSSSPVSCNGVR